MVREAGEKSCEKVLLRWGGLLKCPQFYAPTSDESGRRNAFRVVNPTLSTGKFPLVLIFDILTGNATRAGRKLPFVVRVAWSP